MRSKILLLTLLLTTLVVVDSLAQEMPLVYDVENTGANCPEPPLPSFSELPSIEALPDPFAWSDATRGRISSRSDWRCRRAEIGAEVQQYELGNKPTPPGDLEASFSTDSVLTVTVVVDGDTLTLTSTITLPDGEGPFPALIGVGFGGAGSLPPDIFTSRGIAIIQYNFGELAPWGFDVARGSGGFYELYPNPEVGFFAAWAWGVSRLIDGLEKTPETNLDLSKLAVTGCSFAGKIALFSGAFDERIALTIAQESGGGGYTAWRVTETLDGDRETLRNAQGAPWYYRRLQQFNSAVTKLPYDHHELMAMVAPRALFVTGNPDYEWLADESGHVASKTTQEVWNALGVPDRFGFSIVAGHPHCVLPESQIPEVEAFVEKFLLGNERANTAISTSPYTTDLSPWITWDTPALAEGTTSIGDFESVPDRIGLLQNYPNPFSSRTTIKYVVQKTSHVELKIYNSIGQLIKTLRDGLTPSGEYSVIWEGRNDSGKAVPSGMYFYRLKIGELESDKMMIYIR